MDIRFYKSAVPFINQRNVRAIWQMKVITGVMRDNAAASGKKCKTVGENYSFE